MLARLNFDWRTTTYIISRLPVKQTIIFPKNTLAYLCWEIMILPVLAPALGDKCMIWRFGNYATRLNTSFNKTFLSSQRLRFLWQKRADIKIEMESEISSSTRKERKLQQKQKKCFEFFFFSESTGIGKCQDWLLKKKNWKQLLPLSLRDLRSSPIDRVLNLIQRILKLLLKTLNNYPFVPRSERKIATQSILLPQSVFYKLIRASGSCGRNTSVLILKSAF